MHKTHTFTAIVVLIAAYIPVQAQIPCEPLYYFDPLAQEAVYLHPLPTPWFGIRMSPQWDADVDSAYFAFGIQKNNSPSTMDTLQVRILDSTLPVITVLASYTLLIPANLMGQVPDDYWVAEFRFIGQVARILPARDFWLSWRLKGAPVNLGRIRLKKPAINPSRSVVINANGSTVPISSYVFPQITEPVDLWAETRVCYFNGIPVELTSFEVEYLDGKVLLRWTTSTETENFGFEIERMAARSEDGAFTVWNKLGFVHGNGTTTKSQAYHFLDLSPHSVMDSEGIVRYRLKQIDYDGTASYSPIRALRVPGDHQGFRLSAGFPNPASWFNGSSRFDFVLPENAFVRITLYDPLGRPVQSVVEGIYEKGTHQAAIDVSGLPAGLYYISFVSGSTRLTQRLMILD